MIRLLRYFFLLVLVALVAETSMAQEVKIREIHKVKRKETIFGIAKSYGISIEDLMMANPQMGVPGYELKKGDKLNIPYPIERKVEQVVPVVEQEPDKPVRSDMRRRPIRIGVMLPLHDKNAAGVEMLDYYRGILMACDSLKLDGISVDIHAWNVEEATDISAILDKESAKQCDLIVGPYYSKHVKAVSDFAMQNDIKLLVPFLTTSEIKNNPNLFQVCVSDSEYNEAAVKHFIDKFSGYNVVFVDCNDATSNKGKFTMPLRSQLSSLNRSFSITNLNSSEKDFSNAFKRNMHNVVVLNSARSSELNVAFAKLNNLIIAVDTLKITMFGYPEWMKYTTYNLDNYYKFDTYIPSTYYLNPLSSRTSRIEQKYRWNFHADMRQELPRAAITGFDHAYYFIKGMKMYGQDFVGTPGRVGVTPIQTPLGFKRVEGGGLQNQSILFVHYTPNHRIETIIF